MASSLFHEDGVIRAVTFSAASHKTSTLRSPDFASSMILAAIASSVRWARRGARRAARAISNANAHETRGLRIKYMAV